ncbi:MAG: amidohydrolase, partial [Lentisphaerae bacterium]|nr:amidohydrolase [Lentisphaerota bacterium]
METLLETARQGLPLMNSAVLDLHGHFGRYAQAIPDLTAKGLVGVLDRVGVKSIVVSHMQCISWHASEGNDEVLEATRAHPGRILGYALAFPVFSAAARHELERRLGEGFVGLKLHNSNGIPYNHPGYADALALANERRLPVLLHTWGTQQDFEIVRELAGRYPDCAFLMAHAGAGDGAKRCIQLAGEFEHVYLDTAFSAGPRGLVEELVAGAGAGKVVFGSDCYFFSLTQQIGKVVGSRISDEEKRCILAGNAEAILRRADITP